MWKTKNNEIDRSYTLKVHPGWHNDREEERERENAAKLVVCLGNRIVVTRKREKCWLEIVLLFIDGQEIRTNSIDARKKSNLNWRVNRSMSMGRKNLTSSLSQEIRFISIPHFIFFSFDVTLFDAIEHSIITINEKRTSESLADDSRVQISLFLFFFVIRLVGTRWLYHWTNDVRRDEKRASRFLLTQELSQASPFIMLGRYQHVEYERQRFMDESVSMLRWILDRRFAFSDVHSSKSSS